MVHQFGVIRLMARNPRGRVMFLSLDSTEIDEIGDIDA